MARIAFAPGVLFTLVNLVTSCGGRATSPPAAIRDGDACQERNAKAVGVTGCDLCVCIQGHWSCKGPDCACKSGDELPFGDGCTVCPCTDGKFRCTYTPCVACPPPRTDLSCEPRSTWARDEASGLCCKYEKPCAVNAGWPTYASEAECNPLGCSCDRTAGAPAQPVACGCPPTGCPSLSEALKGDCSTAELGIPVLERRGCGKVELAFFGGISGWLSVFDQKSGAMIGRATGLDQQFGVCNVFGYTFGEQFDCADVESECAHCGLPIARPDVQPCAKSR